MTNGPVASSPASSWLSWSYWIGKDRLISTASQPQQAEPVIPHLVRGLHGFVITFFHHVLFSILSHGV